MPRYFFNVHGVNFGADDTGEELVDDEAAWKEATAATGELFKDMDGRYRPGQTWNLEVADDGGRVIYVINISSKSMK